MKTPLNYKLYRGSRKSVSFFVAATVFGSVGSVCAQNESDSNEVFELSPFQVDAESDVGYAATETLAGTRLRTNVRDVGAAMTIMTPEFLEDIGAVSFEEALEFAPNTDTFEAGIINTPDGLSTRNQNQITVRGFANTSLSRDFFPSLYRADTYNTERLTFSRGPNSILFGIAQPGGITNALSKRARFGNVREVANRIDDEGSLRFSFDFNAPLVEDVLAFRVAGLDYETKYWREPEFEKGTRIHTAAKLKPFGKSEGSWNDLEINVTYEDGDTDSQRLGRNEPIYDRVTPWIEAGRPLSSAIGTVTNANAPDGIEQVINAAQLYIIDQSSVPSAQSVPILNWRRMARGARPAAADSDQSRNASLLDESILPFDVNYLGGSRRYTDEFSTFQVIANKSFFRDLHVEAAYNYQDYDRVSIEEIRGPALNVDVNQFLPNGDPNPNVGLYYLDGPIVRNQPFGQTRQTSTRLSVSYEIDFTRNENWAKHLGRLRLAGSLESQDDKFDLQWIQLSNLTPLLTNQVQGLTGPRAFPAAINSPRNRVNFRQYLDPANGYNVVPASSENYPGPFYAGDTLPDIADAGGVSSAFIADFPGFNTITENRSDVFAAQWFFLNDRIVATYGKRTDEQTSWNANGLINADTVGGLRPFPRGYNPKDDPDSRIARSGSPETRGIVAYPHKSIGLFYNESDNFLPVGQQFDIAGEIFPNQTGEGKDYGIKFFLLDSTLSGSISWFETAQVNQPTGFIRAGARGIARAFTASANGLWNKVAEVTGDSKYLSTPYLYDIGPFFNALQDINSEGVEFQMVWNPTPGWRILFNYSEQEGVYQKLAPRMATYFNEFVPSEVQGTLLDEPLDNPIQYSSGEVTTIGELITATQADIVRIQSLVGTADTRQPLSSANLVANYSFAKDSALAGWTVGGNVRWRDDRFMGFPFGSDGISIDGSNPFLGGKQTDVDALIRYRTKLFDDKVDWSIQMNVRNLFDKTDLLPFQIDGPRTGKVVRWSYQTPRSIMLTNTFKF